MANGYKDTSASGTKVTIIAVPSLPAGLTITEFPADTNPVEIDEQEIASYKMGANGDLIVSGTPAPVTVKLAVIPGSDADLNLKFLYNTNRTAKNKLSVHDVITMIITHPDGSQDTYSNGAIISGSAGPTISGSGEFATRTYSFVFES